MREYIGGAWRVGGKRQNKRRISGDAVMARAARNPVVWRNVIRV